MFRGFLRSKAGVKQVTLAAFLALLLPAATIALLLAWSASRTDAVSLERQKQLVSRVLDRSAEKLAREQEGLILKDNAVRMWTRPITTQADWERAHNNAGPFLHRYYGHDESYVLDGGNRPLYAMREGAVLPPATFEAIRTVALPVIARLRAETARLPLGQPVKKSPGAYDIMVVNGHPAILSVKPMLSPTGKVLQPPGREVLQISVLYLDGPLLNALGHDYLFEGHSFSWTDRRSGSEALWPFVSPQTQRTIGYFIWQPYAPGSTVLRDMMVPLCLALLLVGAVVWLLIGRIRASTRELLASEAHAKHLAFHDALTGLPNRALFEDRVDRALVAGRRDPSFNVALLCLDIDRFKQVNDTLGHPAGDELIRQVAERLRSLVRETDTVARLGGDEFAIVQSGVRSQADVITLCDRILEHVARPFDLMGSQVVVGMSIGVARAGVDAEDRTELTRKADIALYRAKAEGRGQYALFRRSMDTSIRARQHVEVELRAALDAGSQLQVHYQPQYSAATGAISGVEALVRWNHPQHGLMPPATFIPIAEEMGLIERLGEWVLERACAAAAAWPLERLSVNVSPVQLRNPLFAERVLKILQTTGFEATRLELEITETCLIDSVDRCQPNLQALRSAGVRIALDDFGTGYSSFSHLRDLEVDRVKIDRSFIAGIEAATNEAAIVEAIVKLARASGLAITAEGVETTAQSEFLRSIGCDELQGFLLSRPLTSAGIDALFAIPRGARQPLRAA